jgi:hypothetical protein
VITEPENATVDLSPWVGIAIAEIPPAALIDPHQVEPGVLIAVGQQYFSQGIGFVFLRQQRQFAPRSDSGRITAFSDIGDSRHRAIRAYGQPGAARQQVLPGQNLAPCNVALPPFHGRCGPSEEFIPVGGHYQREMRVLVNRKYDQTHAGSASGLSEQASEQ